MTISIKIIEDRCEIVDLVSDVRVAAQGVRESLIEGGDTREMFRLLESCFSRLKQRLIEDGYVQHSPEHKTLSTSLGFAHVATFEEMADRAVKLSLHWEGLPCGHPDEV